MNAALGLIGTLGILFAPLLIGWGAAALLHAG
jgi:hypothetical protein